MYLVEGSKFLPYPGARRFYPVDFTDEEVEELQAIADELDSDERDDQVGTLSPRWAHDSFGAVPTVEVIGEGPMRHSRIFFGWDWA